MRDKARLFTMKACMLLLDAGLIYLAFSAAYWIRFDIRIIPVLKEFQPFSMYQEAIPFVILIWLIIFFQNNIYRLRRYHLSAFDELFRIVKIVTVGTVITMAATFMYREFSYSRLLIAYAWFLGIILIFTAHQFLKFVEKIIIKRYLSPEKILLIGGGKIADNLKEVLNRNHIPHFQIKENPNREKLKDAFRNKKITEIIMVEFPTVRSEILSIAGLCEQHGVKFRLIPDLLALRMGELIIDEYYGMPVMQLKSASLYGVNFFIKRAMDIIFAVVFIVVFFIPLLLICLLIKLDSPGPVLYVQERVGYKGKVFRLFKFRTMAAEAEQMFNEVRPLNERAGAAFKIKNDPRRTRIGRILRRYSLDEIPQVFNILRREMSLVGPRPQVPWEARHNDEWAKRRLRILPGITGLWQVSGRSDLSYEEMIRLDIYYIENWSLGLDLKIILKTIPAVFSQKGAY